MNNTRMAIWARLRGGDVERYLHILGKELRKAFTILEFRISRGVLK